MDNPRHLDRQRCAWAGSDPLYVRYHDTEWGVPLHDDRKLFEFLILDGQQAGLSWITILRKRENYRTALDGFNPEKMAFYGPEKMNALLNDSGIVRNRLKIQSMIQNARAFLAVRERFGSFDAYLWDFVDGRPHCNARRNESEIPAFTPTSQRLSRDLKKRGFSFVGPTICYAFMQAAGLVNDHVVRCFRYAEIADLHENDWAVGRRSMPEAKKDGL